MGTRASSSSKLFTASSVADSDNRLADLYAHPGFLLRRAHHIAVSLFVKECGTELTPPQFSALQLVQAVPGIDLAGLSRTMGFDRTTATLVVNNLVKSQLLTQRRDHEDRRRQHLEITAEGASAVERIRKMAEGAERRLLAPFAKAERKQFVDMLTRFVAAFNDDSRTPIDKAALPRARERLKRAKAAPSGGSPDQAA